MYLPFFLASIFLMAGTSGYASDSNDPQNCKQYGMVANNEGHCVPDIKLTGDLQKIFIVDDCHAISGLTCKITYNGKLPLPSEIYFIEYNKAGTVVGKKTRLIYPEFYLKALEKGPTGKKLNKSFESRALRRGAQLVDGPRFARAIGADARRS